MDMIFLINFVRSDDWGDFCGDGDGDDGREMLAIIQLAA